MPNESALDKLSISPSKVFQKVRTISVNQKDVIGSIVEFAKTPSKLMNKIASTVKKKLQKFCQNDNGSTSINSIEEPTGTISEDQKNNNVVSSYPLLEKHNLPTNLNSPLNKMKIQNVLREIVHLHKESNRDITFVWANGRRAYMSVIERVKNRTNFRKMNRDWIMGIVTSMNPSKPEEAASCLSSWLLKTFQSQFIEVATKFGGLFMFKKLNQVQLAAALDEANITHNACNILMRHINHHLGVRLIEPLKKVVDLGHFPFEVKFGSAKIEKERGKKEENVEYFTIDICEAFASDLERLLNQEDQTGIRTKFGYERNGMITVDVIAGSDHGQGASRFVAKMNYLPSSERRKKGRIDFGSRQITFSKIVCKKDTYEIMNLTATDVRNAFKRVKESMFLAERDDEGVVRVKVVEKREHTDSDESWVVIPDFTLFICGDLAWYALAMGRNGCSGSRCPYCILKISEFQMEDKDCLPLTLEKLNQCSIAYHDPDDKSDTLGVRYRPMVQEENMNYILPCLHVKIGLTNKILQSFLDFIDRYIEALPEVEIKRRKELKELQPQLEEMMNELNQIKEDKKKFTDKRKAANVLVKEKRVLLSKAKQNNREPGLSTQEKSILEDKIKVLKEEILAHQSEFEEFKELASYAVKEFEEKEGKRKDIKEKFDKLKKSCSNMKKSRKGDKDGLEALIEEIMREEANIKPEAYHGGALNGMSCQRLMGKAKEIMNRVSNLCQQKFTQRNEDDGYEMITQERLTAKLNLYTTMFGILDVIFSLLYQPAPTEEEIV